MFTEVPYGLCYDCEKLQTINMSPNTKSIGKEAFYLCKSMKSISFPEGLTVIDTLAFNRCDSLVQLPLPSTLRLIHEGAFKRCSQLEQISIPASVDSIGSGVFNDCKALHQFTVEKGNTPLKFWSQHSWMGWSTVFRGIENLETVIMGRPVKSDIPSTYGCKNLLSFEYTYAADEVADNQFDGCTNLREVTFCGTPARIGREAFRQCDSLVSLNLPEGVTSIDEMAFYYCQSLEHVGLPQSLSVIGKEAFRACKKFERFTVPAQVDSIANEVFNECSNLKTVVFAPSSKPLTYVDALRGAPIDTIYLDRDIQSLNGRIDSESAKKLYVGTHVSSLGDGLFTYCGSLDEIYCLNPVPTVCEGANVFMYLDKSKCRLHVPIGSLDAYKEAFVWKDFFNIDEVSGVSAVSNDAATISAYYTLDGRRISGQPATKGLYIVRSAKGRLQGKNGKKVMVK